MTNPSGRTIAREGLGAFRKEMTGRTIVFTNGCFDIIHKGHVSLLGASRAMGDCLVVGIPDEKFGNAVTAVASLSPGASVDAATIIASVKGNLAGFKAPKTVVFVDQIPRAPNGKANYKAAKVIAESK